MSGVQVFASALELREHLRDKQVVFVPTMGSLHEGHKSLIETAASFNMTTVASIFVNPTQFNDPNDFKNYPRSLEDDIALAGSAGCDVIFAPAREELYPPGDSTKVVVSGVSEGFEGSFRPGHFDGVATVVAKLFLIVQPNIAVFGEKDWQQCLVVKRLIVDLHLPIELRTCKTVREADGLAMSSRNARLSQEQRERAPLLFACLQGAAEAYRTGLDVQTIEGENTRRLEEAGFDVEYFSIVDSQTLGNPGERDQRVIVAARLGEVRLIDNLLV